MSERALPAGRRNAEDGEGPPLPEVMPFLALWSVRVLDGYYDRLEEDQAERREASRRRRKAS